MPTRLSLDTVWLRSIRLGARHNLPPVSACPAGHRPPDGRLRTLLRPVSSVVLPCTRTRAGWSSPVRRKSAAGQEDGVCPDRSLIAAHADELSVGPAVIPAAAPARDAGAEGHLPAVLNGPTSTVWLEPWRETSSPVGPLHFKHAVQEIHYAERRIEEVIVRDKNGTAVRVRRWYVAAPPFNHAGPSLRKWERPIPAWAASAC